MEVNQGYTTMYGQPVIKNFNLCSFLKLETTFFTIAVHTSYNYCFVTVL